MKIITKAEYAAFEKERGIVSYTIPYALATAAEMHPELLHYCRNARFPTGLNRDGYCEHCKLSASDAQAPKAEPAANAGDQLTAFTVRW